MPSLAKQERLVLKVPCHQRGVMSVRKKKEPERCRSQDRTLPFVMTASVALVSLTAVLLWVKGITPQTTNDCGRAPLSTRIVGGDNATAGSWPWQVSVHFRGGHICGGTLIHSEWVLTAAHCILSMNTSLWTLYLGRETQSASGTNPNEVSRGVQTIIPHPNYNNTLLNNDITLLRLSQPVIFTDYIRPLCLASSSSAFHSATACWATGWGNIGEGEPLPSPQNLQEVEVPVVGDRECVCNYRTVNVIITDQMICAGTGGRGVCQGDSGGPLQCKQGSAWVLAGLASFGVPCALPDLPEVFARVSEFQTWITENVDGSSVGFVTFSPTSSDPDSTFTCQASDPSAATRPTPTLSLTPCLLLIPSALVPLLHGTMF